MKVDSKGRIVLPQDLRDRLGLDAGTEVVVREEGRRIVVEPEDDPSAIIEDIETTIEDATASRERTPYGDLDATARDHVDAIRRQAEPRDGRRE